MSDFCVTGWRAMLAGTMVLALAGCGGAAGSSASAGTSGASVLELSAILPITAPAGSPPITALSEAMVVGDHAILRSASASASATGTVHPGTRFTVLDADGRATSSIDYGYSLAAGYNGSWAMLPAPDGFALLQLEGGARLLRFDPQARLLSVSGGLNLYDLPSGGTLPTSVLQTAVAGDGNGLWAATTFTYPQSDGSAIYRLKLTKFDLNGNVLTPTAIVATAIKALHPMIAASAGAVALGWSDGSQPALAYWAQGGGGPVLKGNAAGSASADFRLVALNGNGALGLLWTILPDRTRELGAVLFDGSGNAVLPAGRSSWELEALSASWGGTRRKMQYDAVYGNGRLMLADVVQESGYGNDTVVLADYGIGSTPLSTLTPLVARVRRPLGARPLGNSSVLRQLLFSDHALLLVGDDEQLEGARVTRK